MGADGEGRLRFAGFLKHGQGGKGFGGNESFALEQNAGELPGDFAGGALCLGGGPATDEAEIGPKGGGIMRAEACQFSGTPGLIQLEQVCQQAIPEARQMAQQDA